MKRVTFHVQRALFGLYNAKGIINKGLLEVFMYNLNVKRQTFHVQREFYIFC